MKIGFNMLLWTANLTPNEAPLLKILKDVGYDGVELFLGDPELSSYKTLAPILRDHGLACTTVTCPPPEANPVSADAGERAKGLDHMKWGIDATVALGGEILCGPFHSAYAVFSGKAPTADEFNWSVDVMRDAANYANQAGITLATEPINRFETYLLNTSADAKRFCDQVNHPSFGYLYDTHHAHIEEKDVRQAITTGGQSIYHVHISENDRGAPGTGQVDWDTNFAALKEIGYDGWMTIEAFSPDDPDFAGMIHVFREYDPKEAIYKGGYEFIKKMLAK
ncbi:MAG: sugar phosphate isomerase/epimerase family protein [Phycisphaerales bacterium JB063]